MPRMYEAGRPTTGFRRGKRIASLNDVKRGDILIMVSHQFKAENPCRVTRVQRRRSKAHPSIGIEAVYVDTKTMKQRGREQWFTHTFEIFRDSYEKLMANTHNSEFEPRTAYYRAISTRRINASNSTN